MKKLRIPHSKYLIIPDTETMYRLRNQQITIHPVSDSYNDVLSTLGEQLYNQVVAITNSNIDLPVIYLYRMCLVNSGSWFANPSSPHGAEGDLSMLNSWDNRAIEGLLEGSSKYIQTSIVVFYTDTFCLTKSGSIYLLKEKITQI